MNKESNPNPINDFSKAKKVIDYYLLCLKLKDTIRTGWLNWHVKRERIESIAEHIFGVQNLAIAIASEYDYKNLDLSKVIFMLAIHELGETIIGDVTMFQMSKQEKQKIEHEAVNKILSPLNLGNKLEELFLEFDAHKTPESIFAFQCDKLECDIMAGLYGEENCVDLNNQEDNETSKVKEVKALLENGADFKEMWIRFGQQKYNYDDNFLDISNYVLSHKLKH